MSLVWQTNYIVMVVVNVVNMLGGRKVIGRPIGNAAELAQLAERGIPKAALRHLAACLSLDVKELAAYLPTTLRNLQRYKDDQLLSDVVSDRLIGLASVFALGKDVLGDAAFQQWLRLPSAALGGLRPLDLLRTNTGIETVKDELGRIEYGVFA